MTTTQVPPCCLTGIEWEGTPQGIITTFGSASTPVYQTGNSSTHAILFIHDLLGWSYPNTRLLADAYASSANATVYVPDFFHGEVVPFEPIERGAFHEVDIPGFLSRHGRAQRDSEIVTLARELRAKYGKLAAVGFCYGGWAAFRVGAKEQQPGLVDCIVVAHPSLLTKEDIDGVGVPVQILAPEKDPAFTGELKGYFFKKLVDSEVAWDYQHFPGVEHGCLVRGDPKRPGERAAMTRGLNSAVGWFQQHLHGSDSHTPRGSLV